MSLFPIIQPMAVDQADTSLPLCREVAWDFATNAPIFEGGEPVVVVGLEAVRVWVWHALRTTRYRYELFTRDYGCELDSLMGQPYTGELKQAEAARYVREALLTNPYIKAVENIVVVFDDGTLSMRGTIDTVYGEARVYV